MIIYEIIAAKLRESHKACITQACNIGFINISLRITLSQMSLSLPKNVLDFLVAIGCHVFHCDLRISSKVRHTLSVGFLDEMVVHRRETSFDSIFLNKDYFLNIL